MGKYFICKSRYRRIDFSTMREDFRVYECRMPDGSLQRARFSTGPATALILGWIVFAVTSLAAALVAIAMPDAWGGFQPRAYFGIAFGVVMILPSLALMLGDRALMVRL